MPVQPVATPMRQFASDRPGAVYQYDGRKNARTQYLKYGGIRTIGDLSHVPAHRHRFTVVTVTHTSSSADVDCGNDCVGRCTQ